MNTLTLEKHCWAEIDLTALRENYEYIRRTVGGPVCAVVKAAAYGHVVNVVARVLQEAGAAGFAVSSLGEGRHLRRGGITTPILILGYADPTYAAVLAANDLITTCYSTEYAQALSAAAVKAGVKTVVTFTNEGSYETAVESMYLDMIHREKSPFYVQVDGKELPHFLHRRKFEEAESGWYYSQRLKSVQIKYPNPKKDHEVLVSFEQFDLIGM